MTTPQIATITARVENGKVVLSSTHPQLVRADDGSWTFTILEGTPAEVVVHLQAVDDGGGKRTVRSLLRQPNDEWDPCVDWSDEQPYVSPTFVHGQDFRLEVELGASSGSPPRGGGYFQVRDEGGDGD
jgi:hypothetical protein